MQCTAARRLHELPGPLALGDGSWSGARGCARAGPGHALPARCRRRCSPGHGDWCERPVLRRHRSRAPCVRSHRVVPSSAAQILNGRASQLLGRVCMRVCMCETRLSARSRDTYLCWRRPEGQSVAGRSRSRSRHCWLASADLSFHRPRHRCSSAPATAPALQSPASTQYKQQTLQDTMRWSNSEGQAASLENISSPLSYSSTLCFV